ncbi:MAG: VPLPA-CTERM sorting domain-containing protein [Gammaproteobacteria bacterium]
MNRYLAPAMALALAGTAPHAFALSFDDAAVNIHTGDGSGDLVLAIVAGNESLVWDLSGSIAGFGANGDLSFNDIMSLSAAGASFSLSNSEVSAFLTPERAAIAQWQVFGVTNVGTVGDFINTGDVPTNVGIVLTVDGTVNEILGGDLGFQMQSNAQWLNDNVIAGIADNGVLIASANNPHSFVSSLGTHGFAIAGQDATADSLDTTLAFYYLQKDPSRPTEPPLSDSNPVGSNAMAAIVKQLGSFTLAADGTLSFESSVTPIPVPAAAWMLGSGMLALAGVVRRRHG